MNKSKILSIVQDVASSLDIRLHKQDNTFSDLRFKSRVKGVEVYLSFRNKDKRVQAYFSVGGGIGGYRYEPFFSQKITFNDTKPFKAIFNDLMQRLEMDKINEKIALVLKFRAEKQEREAIERAELAAFQRFIPFEDNHSGVFSARKKGICFELSRYKDRLYINTERKDILLRICAAAAQVVEEETSKKS